MKKYLLDTNILIHFFNKTDHIVQTSIKLLNEGQVFTSHIAIAEILVGWNEKKKDEYLSIAYELFPRLGINDEIAELGSKWRREYKEKGITLNLSDALIAATAKTHNCQLVTLNYKHFPMPELTIYKDVYTKSA
ncbi:MAG: type II toxin-antitoxin system VapC family toxin [bacterium]|nr:type II toxin-antitoxin system VapC family toxin [bacterium]